MTEEKVNFLELITTNPPHKLIGYLSDPLVQLQCIDLIKQDATIVLVFLKNTMILSQNQDDICLESQFKSRIIETMISKMYEFSDFNFNVFLDFVEKCHNEINIEQIQVCVDDSNPHLLVRFLKFLKHFTAYYEHIKKSDEVFLDLDKTVKCLYKVIFSLVEKTAIIQRSTLFIRELVIDIIHSLLYQELHYLFEDNGLVSLILTCYPDSTKLIQILLKKYPEFIDYNLLISGVINHPERNNLDNLKNTTEILTLVLKKIEFNNLNLDNQQRIKEFIVKFSVLSEQEVQEIQTDPEYLQHVISYDKYRDCLHPLIRMLVRSENEINNFLSPGSLDVYTSLFLATVSQIKLSNSNEIYLEGKNNTKLLVCFYRYAIKNSIFDFPFDFSTGHGKFYSYFKTDHNILISGNFYGTDEISVYLMRCSIYHTLRKIGIQSGKTLLESVKQSTNYNNVDFEISPVLNESLLMNIQKFLLETVDCTENVQKFTDLFDILALSEKNAAEHVIESIIQKGVEELMECAIYYLIYQLVTQSNLGNDIAQIQALLNNVKHSCKPELANLILFLLYQPFGWFDKFIFIHGKRRGSYSLKDNTLLVLEPLNRVIRCREDILLYLSAGLLDNSAEKMREDFFEQIAVYLNEIQTGMSMNKNKLKEMNIVTKRLCNFKVPNSQFNPDDLNELKSWLKNLPPPTWSSDLRDEWPIYLLECMDLMIFSGNNLT